MKEAKQTKQFFSVHYIDKETGEKEHKVFVASKASFPKGISYETAARALNVLTGKDYKTWDLTVSPAIAYDIDIMEDDDVPDALIDDLVKEQLQELQNGILADTVTAVCDELGVEL